MDQPAPFVPDGRGQPSDIARGTEDQPFRIRGDQFLDVCLYLWGKEDDAVTLGLFCIFPDAPPRGVPAKNELPLLVVERFGGANLARRAPVVRSTQSRSANSCDFILFLRASSMRRSINPSDMRASRPRRIGCGSSTRPASGSFSINPFFLAHETAVRMSVPACAWLVRFQRWAWRARYCSTMCGRRSRTLYFPKSSVKPRAMISKTPGTPLWRVALRCARYWFIRAETG